MKEIGIGTDTPVICYDNDKGMSAVRAAHFLSERGIKRVAVLDGDFKTRFPKS